MHISVFYKRLNHFIKQYKRISTEKNVDIFNDINILDVWELEYMHSIKTDIILTKFIDKETQELYILAYLKCLPVNFIVYDLKSGIFITDISYYNIHILSIFMHLMYGFVSGYNEQDDKKEYISILNHKPLRISSTYVSPMLDIIYKKHSEGLLVHAFIMMVFKSNRNSYHNYLCYDGDMNVINVKHPVIYEPIKYPCDILISSFLKESMTKVTKKSKNKTLEYRHDTFRCINLYKTKLTKNLITNLDSDYNTYIRMDLLSHRNNHNMIYI
jgi:hypothetical protein